MSWVDKVLATYASDRVIVITHAYLYHDPTRYDWAAKGRAQEWSPHAYGTASSDAHDGERLWSELVSKHAGVFLTLDGHVLGVGAGLASDEGLGYLRLLELGPSGAALRMSTYSPILEQWATALDPCFELPIVPPLELTKDGAIRSPAPTTISRIQRPPRRL